jgi:hypothetical protein
MKKLILAIVLVALLAAAVFGGQALASSKSADVIVSEQPSEEILSWWGSSYRGYPVHMKTLSGSVMASGSETLVEETYSGVRHVSLTIAVGPIDDPDDEVYISTDTPGWTYIPLGGEKGNTGVFTYEFDVDNWRLEAWNTPTTIELEVHYWATITYPSNQW